MESVRNHNNKWKVGGPPHYPSKGLLCYSTKCICSNTLIRVLLYQLLDDTICIIPQDMRITWGYQHSAVHYLTIMKTQFQKKKKKVQWSPSGLFHGICRSLQGLQRYELLWDLLIKCGFPRTFLIILTCLSPHPDFTWKTCNKMCGLGIGFYSLHHYI